MAREFKSANFIEFQQIVQRYPFTRRVTEVHLHHTWRPTQSDYRGLATIQGMWRYHTEHNGWSDIGQHVTVAPDGDIWLCRNFNWSPASASGFNGNRTAGPFMIEMIGDFDKDREHVTREQQRATLAVIKSVQHRFSLPASALRFHQEMSSKSCPGNTNDKPTWIGEIDDFVLEPIEASRSATDPWARQQARARDLVYSMNPDAGQSDDMAHAEHDGLSPSTITSARGSAGGPAEALKIDIREELADHVVNLECGQLSKNGRIETTPADLSRLFEERLPLEIERNRREGRKTRLLFYAHGGLTSEKHALISASQQLPFWRSNGIYPLFFIWETSFAETVRQLLAESTRRSQGPASPRSPMDWLSQRVANPVIEELARAGGGGLIWNGMKSSARLASENDGGAARVARHSARLCRRFDGDIEVHVAGHSAGSIFHTYFMPQLLKRHVAVQSAHFLAPAVSVKAFLQHTAPHLGKGIGPLTVYTMSKARERADTVTRVYRSSLLYLVSGAFERERHAPILGLEESLRASRKTRKLFGLQGVASTKAEVIWSPSEDTDTGSSSTALTHGGFDDDKATMESVVRRVSRRQRGEPIEPFQIPQTRGMDDFWQSQFNWPEHLGYLADTWQGEPASLLPSPPRLSVSAEATSATPTAPLVGNGVDVPEKSNVAVPVATSTPDGIAIPTANSGGSRRALCIGINEYARQPLAGCVADAELWATSLSSLGFDVILLRNAEATAQTILRHVQTLVERSVAGDELVLQFAGHGTQFQDIDGDEALGGSELDTRTEVLDECLCAADCDFGDEGLVIDDELREIFSRLPEDVLLTCFLDCCHSGTATRGLLRSASAVHPGQDVRARFLDPSDAMRDAYARRVRGLRPLVSRGAPAARKDVLFSACRSTELAYESDGHGDFTRHATAVIKGGAEGFSNHAFLEAVLNGFGSNSRQNPQIDCEPNARRRSFLGLECQPDTFAETPSGKVVVAGMVV